MSSEGGGLWTTLRTKAKRQRAWVVDLVRVENAVEVGTPDVNYCLIRAGAPLTQRGSEGWVELKHRPAWPKRPGTVVRLAHFTAEQRGWLLRRLVAGGRAWLLLQVARDYLLFDGLQAQRVGQVPRAELEALATRVWRGRLEIEELLEELAR